jgi:hypothetical protein
LYIQRYARHEASGKPQQDECYWHIFVSGDFLLRDMQRLPRFGSDHFPILIRLDHHPQAAEVTEPHKADTDDHAEVDRKLEQVGLDPDQVPRS